MWLYFIFSILPIGNWFSSSPKNDIGIGIGQKFSELDRDMQELLHESKHWKVDNRSYFSTIEAPNTDHCFHYNPDCQPDWEHYVYQVPSAVNKGHYFVVTFSYNYRVLKVEDSFKHSRS